MERQVPFYRHGLTPADAGRIGEVLATPVLTSGNVGKAVEAQICDVLRSKHAGLTNSWTNGALAALLAMDIGPGDEVIVPAMTFIASANVVEMLGATPVFVDVEPDTLLISIDQTAAALTAATKAVMPVHLYGQMVDIRALREALSARPEVAILEDAAHCFEGSFAGAPPGTHGDIALFSFYATKNVTCGEGGAFVTNSSSLYDKMLQTRLHGMSGAAADRYKSGQYRHWDMVRLGVKANLPDLLAALLPEQIKSIHDRLPRREAIASAYQEALNGTSIRTACVKKSVRSAQHLFPIHVPSALRDETIAILNRHNIGVTVNYRSVPTMTYYRDKYGFTPADFPASYDWGEGTLSLPLFPGLCSEDQDFVIETLKREIVPLTDRALAA